MKNVNSRAFRTRLAGVVLVTLLATAAALPVAANQLSNPGFEADASPGGALVYGASGWTNYGLSWTASGPSEPTRSGLGSLRIDSERSFGIPGAYQTLAASAGQTWDLTGYMLTAGALPADATFGLLKIVWSDGVNQLAPGVVDIGSANFNEDAYGIESTPLLDSSSAPGNWQFAQARGVAPAGTTEILIFTILVDQSPATVYFDDIAASVVPEPASVAMMLVGLAGVAGAAGVRRRRR
jgi:PEP-CTERM motif